MAIPVTDKLSIPYVVEGQANAEYQVNNMLAMMDAVLQLSLIDDNPSTTPPASPSEGDRYLVPTSATGAWVGQDGDLAVVLGGTWIFITPREGWMTWVEDINQLKVYNGTTWERIGTQGAAFTTLGITAGASYSQTDMQDAVDKLDAVITELQTAGHMS